VKLRLSETSANGFSDPRFDGAPLGRECLKGARRSSAKVADIAGSCALGAVMRNDQPRHFLVFDGSGPTTWAARACLTSETPGA
jgi:hypothetical protein